MPRHTIVRLVLVAAIVAGLGVIIATLSDQGGRGSLPSDATENVVEVVESVQEKDLPGPVADAMHSHPRASYVSGTKVTRGGEVEYRLTVRGTRKTAMVVKPDGTVMSFK